MIAIKFFLAIVLIILLLTALLCLTIHFVNKDHEEYIACDDTFRENDT